MKKTAIATVLAAGGLLLGALSAEAKLPPPTPAEKAAAAEKAAKAKEAAAKEKEALAAAEDRAVANYKKNKGMPVEQPAAPAKAPEMHKKHK